MDVEAAVLVAVIALAFAQTLPSFEPGQIASWDGPAHLVRAEHFERSLNRGSLGLWGWYHGWYLGVAPFLFYPPGFFAALSLMKAGTFGLASMSLITKVLVAATFTLLPAALFWCGRALGLTRRAAALAALLSLGCSADFGAGIEGVYGIGLYAQAFSLCLFTGFLGQLMRSLRDEASPVPAGLLLAALFLTSVVTAAFATLAAPIAWIARGGWRRAAGAARFAAVFAVAVPCAAFWLFPFVRSLPLAGPDTAFKAFTLRELPRRFLSGEVVLPPETAALAALGALLCLARWRRAGPERPEHATLLALFAATLILGSSLPGDLITGGWPGRLLRSVLRTRGLAFLWIFGPLLAGLAIEAILDLAGRKHLRLSRALLIAASAALLCLGAQRLSDRAGDVRTLEHPAFAEARQEWRPALAWLRTHAPPDSVVLTDINWGALQPFGTVSIDSLINLEAGLRTVRGNQTEAAQLALPLDRLRFRTRADEALLRRVGANYVLMYEKPFYWPPFLEPVYMSERIVIYRVLPGAAPLLSLELFPNRYRARVRVEAAQALELPIQYNDHWSAHVGGEPRAVSRSDVGLVEVAVPPGESVVELVFGRSAAETAACLMSLLSFAACLALLARERRRSAPPA